jgi:hypothetical protein
MASKVGKVNDILDIKRIEEQLNTTKKGLLDISKMLEKIAEQSAKLSLDFKGAVALRDYTKARQEQDSVLKESIRLQKEFETLRAKEVLQSMELTKKVRELKEERKKEAETTRLQAQVDKALTGSLTQLEAQVKLMKKEYSEMSKAQRNSREEGQKLLSSIQNTDKEIKTLKKSMGDHKDEVGNYTMVWDKLKSGLAVAGGVMAGVWGVLKSGEAVIKSSHALTDKFEEVTTGLSFAWDSLLRTIATGDWSNLFTNMTEATRVGMEYARTLDEIAERQASIDIVNAKSRNLVLQYQMDMRDKTKDDNERAKAGRLAMEEENKILTRNYAISLVNRDIVLKKYADQTKLSQATVLQYVTERDQNRAKVVEAERYLEVQKTIVSLSSQTGTGPGGGLGVTSAKDLQILSDARKELAGFSKETEIFATQVVAKVGNASDKLFKDVRDAVVGLEETQQEFKQGTKRTWSTYTGFLASAKKETEDARKKLQEEYKKLSEEQKKTFQEKLMYQVEIGRLSIFTLWDLEEQKIKETKAFQKLSTDEQVEYLNMKWGEWFNKQMTMAKETAEELQRLFAQSGVLTPTGDVFGTGIKEKPKAKEKAPEPTEDMDMSGASAPSFGSQEQINATNKKLRTDDLVADAEYWGAKADLVGQVTGQMTALVDMYFANQFRQLDLQMEKDSIAKEQELARAGNNAKKRDEIEKKYAEINKQRDKERRKLERDQAKYQKTAGIVSAVINTAQGVTGALASAGTLGPVGAIIMAVLVGLMGIAQIALIASQPIPSYFRGRKKGKEELAITGDRYGSEMVVHPDGSAYITPGHPTLTHLPEGASVIPHDEMMRMMERSTHEKVPVFTDKNGLMYGDLGAEMRGGFSMLNNTVKNKKEYHLEITERGLRKVVSNGAVIEEHINSHIRM